MSLSFTLIVSGLLCGPVQTREPGTPRPSEQRVSPPQPDVFLGRGRYVKRGRFGTRTGREIRPCSEAVLAGDDAKKPLSPGIFGQVSTTFGHVLFN